MKPSLIREEGFTLLEVVFASAILAFAIMAYTILKSSSRHSRVYSKNLSHAVELTSTQMDWLRIQGYKSDAMVGEETSTGASFDYVTNGPTDALISDDFIPDLATWTVRDKCPSELTKMVQYNMTWNIPAGGDATSPTAKNLNFAQVQTLYD